MKYGYLVAALALMSAPAHSDEPMTAEQVSASAKEGVEFVSDSYVRERQAENADLLLFDVRTKQEYDLGRLPGAVWMPRGKLEFDVAKSVREADAEIILYCKTGSRAALGKKALEAQGYTNVAAHSGFESWSEAGGVIETDLGMLRQLSTTEE